jgi:flagellar basal-body rod modification protein FlgD
MQNQDPTADTDPNEYINQLVSVNSLEQLIDINQNLSTALGTTSTSSGAGVATTPETSPSSSPGALTSSATAAGQKNGSLSASPSISSVSGASTSAQGVLSTINHASGNLSVPEVTAASQRVAHSLDGKANSHSIAALKSAAQSSL